MWKLKIGTETLGGDGGGGSERWLRSLNNHLGRQVWEFHPELGTPEELQQIDNARRAFSESRFEKRHSSDLLMRNQFAMENPSFETLPQGEVEETEKVREELVTTTIRRAISFYSTIQAHDGHWPGDYGGPLFLIPGLNKDGGWGLHIEGPSTMFGTALNYVTLRLLGEGADDGLGAMEEARIWILDRGGATAITSWGKMWLSVLGIYEWSGNNPLPPEVWLCPYILPCHPGRMWCHCRMVYLPMSYLYGKRFVGPITPTVQSLRKELYAVPYDEIDWNKARNLCAKNRSKEFQVSVSDGGAIKVSEWSRKSYSMISLRRFGAVWMANLVGKLLAADADCPFVLKFNASRAFLAQRCWNKVERYAAIVEYGEGRRRGLIMVPKHIDGRGWNMMAECF
ncbi:Cycloartenol synthase [Morella rubra]|uniref:Cycloartenol synthase n=1 Tax=Morella rubra TaxID=262757 RepID=A0A6A1VJK9_9ROSI|nr:Cycloartenol synthase [Morella rubra]